MLLAFDTLHVEILSGTTAQARPELAGVVLEDRLRPFASGPSELPVTGVLQERIVRSSVDATLAFYYRIKELTGGPIGYGLSVWDWPTLALQTVDVDYRIDGLGDVGPQSGRAGPEPITFQFNHPAAHPVSPSALSRFMFIKMVPGKGRPVVTSYNTRGRISINDVSWSATLTDSFMPEV